LFSKNGIPLIIEDKEITQRVIANRSNISITQYIVGWVKRDVGTIYVGFAYLNAPQKIEIAT
jgi:hypothetical protein